MVDRRTQIIAAAREIVAHEGRERLTMRRVADSVGMRAPSLYKHFPGKGDFEQALIEDCLGELRILLAAARRTSDPVGAFAVELVRFAHQNEHLYRMVSSRPFAASLGDTPQERAALVFVQGMVDLELSGRLDPEEVTRTWHDGLQAFSPGSRPRQFPTVVRSVRGPD